MNNEESKSARQAASVGGNEELKSARGKYEETKSVNTGQISHDKRKLSRRKVKFEHEGMRIGSAMPVTSDKAFLMYRDKMVLPYQSEEAQNQNSQTALDIGRPC